MEKFKEKTIRLKEGSTYRIKIEFFVQRDIVSGLKFIQSAYKGPIRSKTIRVAFILIYYLFVIL